MRRSTQPIYHILGLVVSLTVSPLWPAGSQNAPVVTDPNLTVSTVVSGLPAGPTAMAFVGADEFLLLEKNTGKVQHVSNGLLVGTAIDLAVNTANERGALGIVLHPNFSLNHFVYVFWTWKGSGTGIGNLEGSDSDDPTVVPTQGNRIDRFVWNGSTLTFNRSIFKFSSRNVSGVNSAQHTGGVLAFGSDGKLYAFAGDQNIRGKLQNIKSGPGPTNPNFTGVIVRLNPDGTIPSDNPFFAVGAAMGGEAGQNVQRLFAYGMRNSFGIAFDPMSDNLWMEENGDDAFDELNFVPPGFNSRWIQIMGPNNRYSQYRNIEVASGELDNPAWPPTNLASTVTQARARLFALDGSHERNPTFSWKFAMGLAGIGFLNGSGLGAEYSGDLFVGDVLTGSLYHFNLNSARTGFVLSDPVLMDRVADNTGKGDLTESESLIIGGGFGVITDIETGPDGNLNLVSFSNRAVYRIAMTP